MTSGPYAILQGHFILHETIGSGGFGKVKAATHVLTGEKVAIKIMDKITLGDDLPRVQTEVKALKELGHQNVCRLYQVLETEERIFLVLEHCAGGELFDYIVKKDRLQEPEARHFFRQIVSAIHYVHGKGYAHRDLKPENLLLTEDLQVKVIDFGLCAKPEHGLNRVLETCCGSPAYAAPELIFGQSYFGNEADVWSLGILLYTLLCGFLPFEDENLQVMYKKVQAGRYDEPHWLSDGSKRILKAMLQTNPKRRIRTEELLTHPWLTGDYKLPLKWRSIYEPAIVDRECVLEMALHYGYTTEAMLDRVDEWNYDEISCTYFLLLQRKRQRKPVILPPGPWKGRGYVNGSSAQNSIVRSPTIHASLDRDLNQFGETDDEDGRGRRGRTTKHLFDVPKLASLEATPAYQTPKCSYTRAVAKSADSLTPFASKRSISSKQSVLGYDKENVQPNGGENGCGSSDAEKVEGTEENHVENEAKMKPETVKSTQWAPMVVYSTPAGNKVRKIQLTTAQIAGLKDQTPLSTHMRQIMNEEFGTMHLKPPLSDRPPSGCGRSPRSKSRVEPFRRRVFNSVERKVDRVITALTPKRYRGHTPTPVKVRLTQTLVNVSTTSSKCEEQVLAELLRVFGEKGITCKQRGWTIRGKTKDKDERTTLTFELEVVYVESLQMVGVRRKRLNGPSFMYKKICEDILNLAGL